MNSAAKPSARLSSIDALRGIVMIIMALDHVRDFFHAGAMSFSPTDLTRTTPILFFTRWITHFCMPVFMFTAGMGAFLFEQRSGCKGRLSRFLWTRGLWFILLELTVMQLSYSFNFSYKFLLLLLILWIFGICMIAMAALIHVPLRWLATLSVAMIVFHNLLDGINPTKPGVGTLLWALLHRPGVFPIGGKLVLLSYPVIPWIAVIAAGYCFGQVFLLEPARRRRLLVKLGLGITVAFVVLRAVNRYGDPAPWSHQSWVVFTVLSFLNCTKYPASLDFLLMTLGPAMLVLAYLDGRMFGPSNPVIIFGRVPMFYFVVHFYLIHLIAVVAAFIRYGKSASAFIFNPLPSMGGPAQLFPANFGYSLGVVYGVWVLTVALLYPICRWFAKVKATRRDWWLGYL
jgi:uncharacterized membrane protein